jgi:diacylglycerol kinase family enzyme
MYFYLYDESLAEPKLATVVADIETRLTDLGLSGRVGRLGPLKSSLELTKAALKAGAKTVVAVGNDRTVSQAINALTAAGASSGVALGILPVGKPTAIADLLGIPDGERAVAVLAARTLATVDLGRVNNYYFLTSIRVEARDPVTLTCDGRYRVQPLEPVSTFTVRNLDRSAACQDGYLEATVEGGRQRWWGKVRHSVVPIQRGEFTAAGPATVVAEGTYTANLPVTVEVVPRALRVIVGRNRVF